MILSTRYCLESVEGLWPNVVERRGEFLGVEHRRSALQLET